MKYFCNLCNYETDNKSTWYKHKKTDKHNKLINLQKIIDENENNKLNDYVNKQNQRDINNQIDSLNQKNEIELLKEKLKSIETEKNIIKNQLDKIIDQYEIRISETKNNYEKQFDKVIDQYEERLNETHHHIETLKFENNFQKQLINSAGGIIQRSMNTMSYLLLNYNNAPALTHLADYSIISKNTDSLIQDLIFYYKKNKLDKHIGDFIIQQYKKTNPELQSFWSSDVDRLNYFIRELINDTKPEPKLTNKTSETRINKKNNAANIQWIVDKKGIKMTESIIDPLLKYIQEINSKYLQQKNEEINTRFNIQNDMKLLEDLQVVASINCDIKNKTLSKNINKYIAPHFYLEKGN